jgi:hypothetical protein
LHPLKIKVAERAKLAAKAGNLLRMVVSIERLRLKAIYSHRLVLCNQSCPSMRKALLIGPVLVWPTRTRQAEPIATPHRSSEKKANKTDIHSMNKVEQ